MSLPALGYLSRAGSFELAQSREKSFFEPCDIKDLGSDSFFDTTTNLWLDAFLAGRGGDFDNDDNGNNNDDDSFEP